jgi:chemotaxis protein methyltransferase CheR
LAASHNPAIVTDHELAEIRTLIEQHSGIVFDRAREERFFAARVREHALAKKMAHGSELLRVIRSSNVEYDALLERLLTQETSFFRYPDVFDVFEKRVLPELHARKFWENPRSLRIWSAGCATGEEPYSIAVSISEALEFAEAWDVSILATDISRQALRQAEAGSYPHRELAALTPEQLDTYFVKSGDEYVVKPRIRNMVSFAPMNLAQAVYPGRFDCIFCMNVLIYFSDERRAALIRRFCDYLEPGGFLFLGHAETTNGAAVKFQTIIHRDARVFQKPDRTAVPERDDELEAGRSTP